MFSGGVTLKNIFWTFSALAMQKLGNILANSEDLFKVMKAAKNWREPRPGQIFFYLESFNKKMAVNQKIDVALLKSPFLNAVTLQQFLSFRLKSCICFQCSCEVKGTSKKEKTLFRFSNDSLHSLENFQEFETF